MYYDKDVDPKRDRWELEATKQSLARRLPIFAICKGMQLFNVALGGTLVQDIASQCKTDIAHDEDGPRDSRSHEITVEPKSLIAEAIGSLDFSRLEDPR